MNFTGISREFSLRNQEQYITIGQFWDEMAEIYGLENLQGLGYRWERGKIHYAIGLKDGKVDNANFSIELPDHNWSSVEGKTENLQSIYAEIYKAGPLRYEIETFYPNGSCRILYCR